MVVRRAATLAISVATVAAVLAGCGRSDEPEEASTTTAAPAETTTTEAAPDLEAVGAEAQELLEAADDAIDDEAEARDERAGENDLEGAIDSTRDLRAALVELDGGLRDLDLPDDLAEDRNAVLRSTTDYIEVLDGFVDVEDAGGYNDQLDAEAEARQAWYADVADLADALEIEGIVDDVAGDPDDDDAEGGDDVEDVLGAEVSAGEVVDTSGMSIEVPEGFTAFEQFPIEMIDEAGNAIGIYHVFPEDDTATLEQVAEDYAQGAADKNGFEIIGGPEADDLGSYPAIGYAFATDDTHTEVILVFEAEDSTGTRFHVISVEAADEDVEQVMDALEAVVDTLVVR